MGLFFIRFSIDFLNFSVYEYYYSTSCGEPKKERKVHETLVVIHEEDLRGNCQHQVKELRGVFKNLTPHLFIHATQEARGDPLQATVGAALSALCDKKILRFYFCPDRWAPYYEEIPGNSATVVVITRGRENGNPQKDLKVLGAVAGFPICWVLVTIGFEFVSLQKAVQELEREGVTNFLLYHPTIHMAAELPQILETARPR